MEKFRQKSGGVLKNIMSTLRKRYPIELKVRIVLEILKEEKTVSNFFKTDKKYRHMILKRLVNRYVNNKMKANELEKYLSIFVY